LEPVSAERRFSNQVLPGFECVMTEEEIEQQIERCRRIARMITDEHARRTLERLAEEYAAQLPPSAPSSDDFPGGEHSPRQ
jgi:hypothetical protein